MEGESRGYAPSVPGRVICLRCDNEFLSEDKCCIRICPKCKGNSERFGLIGERACSAPGLDLRELEAPEPWETGGTGVVAAGEGELTVKVADPAKVNGHKHNGKPAATIKPEPTVTVPAPQFITSLPPIVFPKPKPPRKPAVRLAVKLISRLPSAIAVWDY